jgi:hypothetical protein
MRKLKKDAWKLSETTDPWNRWEKNRNRRIRAFNDDPTNDTPFQRLLMSVGCCEEGRLTVKNRTWQEHWKKGGQAGRKHMIDYALCGTGLDWTYLKPMFYENLRMGYIPYFVHRFFNAGIPKHTRSLS